MKKLLLSLLLTIFLIPRVNASTTLTDPLECFQIAPPSSTKNIFINTSNNSCGVDNKTFVKYDESETQRYYCTDYFIEVKPGITYTFTHFDSSLSPVQSPSYNYLNVYDANFNRLSGNQNWFAPPYTITFPDNAKYVLYCSWKSNKFLKYNIQLEEGTISSTSDLSFVAYEEKISTPDEPDKPIIADTTLNSFYTIYIEKITHLSTFATENKFVLSAITIILFVGCLELFLYLARRRS